MHTYRHTAYIDTDILHTYKIYLKVSSSNLGFMLKQQQNFCFEDTNGNFLHMSISGYNCRFLVEYLFDVDGKKPTLSNNKIALSFYFCKDCFAEVFGQDAAAEARRSQETLSRWLLVGVALLMGVVVGVLFAKKP